MYILHKVTKRRLKRILMLVQWKSTAVLKKVLRVQEPRLLKYTLKALKTQVPFLGRKWKFANMHVISMIFMHLKPNLQETYLLSIPEPNQEEANVILQG